MHRNILTLTPNVDLCLIHRDRLGKEVKDLMSSKGDIIFITKISVLSSQGQSDKKNLLL